VFVRNWRKFAQDEWLFLIAFVGMLSTSIYLWRVPSYSMADVEILYILFVLFVVIAGLQNHGAIAGLSAKLERGKFVAMKMVGGTFFVSMVVTNDVALIALVPLTLSLSMENIAWLVILEILAANAGSALSPFGNPQNLYIYWFYQIPFWAFVRTIIVFSGVFLVLLLLGAFFLDRQNNRRVSLPENTSMQMSRTTYIFWGMLVIVVLMVLRILPLFAGVLVILYAILFDRESLKVDYALLATFGCFFGFTDNLQVLLSGTLSHMHHVFLLAALLSQVISNVPTALLLADFTVHWQALLWGVSVGGFGSLVASLANLIAYRIYVREKRQNATSFTVKFHAVSYAAFFIGGLLYFLIFFVG
jgi:Na+/H+ antiporter NhaD/arsenite permease-like protein